MKIGLPAPLVFLTTCLITSLAYAEGFDHSEDHHAEHGAHVHGLAELTLVLENNELEITIESPAMNIVGFEHQASSDADIKRVKKAEALLASAEKMFEFKGGKCASEHIDIDVSGLLKEDDHDHHHYHHHEDEQESGHSDIDATYHFECEQPDSLTAISITAFDYFSGIEEIDAIWVTETEQNSKHLNSKSRSINLQ